MRTLISVNTVGGKELLSKRSKPVKKVTKEIRSIVEDMVRIRDESHGEGIAAPQVGELKRIIALRLGSREVIVINPRIERRDADTDVIEGCLSVPYYYYTVRRPNRCALIGTDLEGNEIRIQCYNSFRASLACHEVDHLDGITIDRIGIQAHEKEQKEESKLAWAE